MDSNREMTTDERRLLDVSLRSQQSGDFVAAKEAYDRLLDSFPDQPALLANRAAVYLALGDATSAETDARRATELEPRSFGAWLNHGLALKSQQRTDLAAHSLEQASALRPGDARAMLEWLSAAAQSQQLFAIHDRLPQPLPALGAFRRLALQVVEELAQFGYSNAAFALLSQLRREIPEDAAVAHRIAIETQYARAALLAHRHETNAALSDIDALLAAVPAHRGARMLRAGLFVERGEAAAALEEYRRIVQINPRDAIAESAMLIAMQHDPACPAEDIAAAHRAWSERHAPDVSFPETPDRTPDRPLRIGWLSPRFFDGLVATFFLHTLERFERTKMTHVLYDSGGIGDSTTEKFRLAADEWHGVEQLDSPALCAKIRADRIDILVELSGHSPDNRLRALAERAAPVQVSWLDYFHSTGMKAIDVLISDNVLTPPELAGHFTERVMRLPSGRLCYAPDSVPSVARRDQGTVRFASFNRVDKINDAVLACWAQILAAVPGSTLRLKARAFDGKDDRDFFVARCTKHGIDSSRLELAGFGTRDEALAAYADVDIALDPFPFSGCATSFDALWMGVPVITLIGETMVSRQTASILSSIGLREFVADSIDEYVRTAQDLALDASRRREFRNSLRDLMTHSVCDPDRNARELADALRSAWQSFCRGEFCTSLSDPDE